MENMSFDLKLALPNHISTVHVEVQLKQKSTAATALVQEHVKKILADLQFCHGDQTITDFKDPFLQHNVQDISICDTELAKGKKEVSVTGAHVQIHVYQLQHEGPSQEELEDEGGDLAAATHWLLPAKQFHGLWDSLVFDADIKTGLLQYASTTLLFSDKQVNSTIIAWNKVVLLHGPPGTGKTSLCQALAQKLTIQLSHRYRYGQLVEINSHSLFSKWFSESGKLVMKMFQKIEEFVEDEEALVFVLIDEVESLTSARKAAMSGSEPSDAIRVVNALLTQLDHIKKHPNVMILTTSNITGAIDLAFVDRADIKQYIGPPSPQAIFRIYHSCLTELMRADIVERDFLPLDEAPQALLKLSNSNIHHSRHRLMEIAHQSFGLSGRTLRKLPFIAHASFVQAPRCTLGQFLEALSAAVTKQFKDREELTKDG